MVGAFFKVSSIISRSCLLTFPIIASGLFSNFSVEIGKKNKTEVHENKKPNNTKYHWVCL